MTRELELWTLVDVDGRPTGQTHRRGSTAWPPGGYHLVGAVCCVRADGRILLTRRAASKQPAGTWEFPGGSAIAGETSRTAAARELQEETGLSMPEALLSFVGRFAENPALIDLFLAPVELDDPVKLRLDPAEVSEAVWLAAEDVEHLHKAGGFAGPWEARLEALWPQLQPMLQAVVATQSPP